MAQVVAPSSQARTVPHAQHQNAPHGRKRPADGSLENEQRLSKRFDLLKHKTMYGKPVTGVERTTYLIGSDGKLLHTFSNVKPQGHAEDVLGLLNQQRVS